MVLVVVDIETAPAGADSTMGEIALSEVAPPGNITTEKTLAKWEEEKRPAAEKAALNQTALQPLRGQQITVIGFAVEDDPPIALVRKKHEAEIKLFQQFWADLEQHLRKYHSSKHGGHGPGDLWRTGVQWLGHNVRFDLASLQAAHIRVGLVPEISFHVFDKPWAGSIIDTCEMMRFGQWRGDTTAKGASLKNLCAWLGWEMENQLEPEEIFQAWEDEEYDKLATYCREDIHYTRKLYHRIMDYTR